MATTRSRGVFRDRPTAALHRRRKSPASFPAGTVFNAVATNAVSVYQASTIAIADSLIAALHLGEATSATATQTKTAVAYAIWPAVEYAQTTAIRSSIAQNVPVSYPAAASSVVLPVVTRDDVAGVQYAVVTGASFAAVTTSTEVAVAYAQAALTRAGVTANIDVAATQALIAHVFAALANGVSPDMAYAQAVYMRNAVASAVAPDVAYATGSRTETIIVSGTVPTFVSAIVTHDIPLVSVNNVDAAIAYAQATHALVGEGRNPLSDAAQAQITSLLNAVTTSPVSDVSLATASHAVGASAQATSAVVQNAIVLGVNDYAAVTTGVDVSVPRAVVTISDSAIVALAAASVSQAQVTTSETIIAQLQAGLSSQAVASHINSVLANAPLGTTSYASASATLLTFVASNVFAVTQQAGTTRIAAIITRDDFAIVTGYQPPFAGVAPTNLVLVWYDVDTGALRFTDAQELVFYEE